jgi:hypothetical protein
MGLTDYTISDKKYFQAGIEYERERIIKLLESIEDYPRGWDYDNPIESVVALIKGEQSHPPQQFRDRSNGE